MRFSIYVKGRKVPSDFHYESDMRSWWIPGCELVFQLSLLEELNWKTTNFFLCLR